MLRSNKLLLALLLPILVVALCFSAFALNEDDYIDVMGEHFTPEQLAAKQVQGEPLIANPSPNVPELKLLAPSTGEVDANDQTLKSTPKTGSAVEKAAPEDNILFESFESGLMPPTGWTKIENNDSTWQLSTYNPYDGVYNAHVLYDDTYSGTQDEWLVSPAVDLTTSGSDWALEFYWAMSYYWGVSPYDNYDMEVWISTDGGSTFSTMLWTEPTASFTNYTWYKASVDLSAYLTETNVAFGFHYAGYDGAEGGIDYISVQTPAVGRCCYGDPMAPSCADETQATCEAHTDFMSWNEGLDCTTPCPVVGEGDNCGNPIAATFPADFASNQYLNTNYTCGRGYDYDATCLGSYDGGEDIMYEFTVTEPIFINITLDPKGTTWSGFALGTECPPTSCLVNATNTGGTAFTASNVILPAGTYYLMIDTYPSPYCIPDFDLIIDYLGAPPAAPENDLCDDATTITVPSQVSGTTIGSTIDCPGLLDWNGVWYVFDISDPSGCSDVTVDYSASVDPLYTVGVVLMNDCACDDYILYDEIQWVSSRPIIKWRGLANGTYYFPAFAALDAADTPMDFVFDISSVTCPPAPANDDCSEAEVVDGPFPQTIYGSTVNSTVDCPGLLDWMAVWYTFDNPYDCANVTIDYCGTTPTLVTVGVVLFPDCTCGTYILHNATSWAECDGNPTSVWNALPAGTYYYPAFTGPGTYGGAPQDFMVTFDLEECPPPEPGDNCTDPLKVTISGSGDLPYVDNNYTCGRGNAASNTCLSYYDGGEDIFYEITVDVPMTLKFILNPQGTTYSAMVLSTTCPAGGTTYTDCMAEVHSSSGSTKSFMYDATPGTYYLMIDTWPTPNCIPAFTLTIEEFIVMPGDNCSDPIKVNLPSDAPYSDLNQYNCGRGDSYNATCLGSYDGGEDIMYEVNVDEAGYYEFLLDPKGTTWAGMAIGADCPPPGSSTSSCIGYVTGSSGLLKGFTSFLAPGTYYLMVDTYPSPYCIPDFDLFINHLMPPQLEYDQTLIEFCGVGADENGCATLNLGNSGDIPLDYTLAVQYGMPPVKSIDGSNISTADGFTPGATADVTFTINSITTGAEWIDEFTMTFPAGVTVNSAQTLSCSSGNMVYDGTTGNGVTVTWTCDDPPNGCIYGGDVEDFIVNLSFDASLSGSIVIDYTISGDDWGDPPHDISGSLVMMEENPLYNWLSVSSNVGAVAGGGNEAIQVCYSSAGLDPGIYFASLVLMHNGGLSPITIPVTMTIGDDHQPAAMILIDRSGSMALTDAFGDTRLERAKALAHTDADDLLGQGYQVGVMAMNETFGMVMMQDFSTDATAIHDAIDLIVDPRHDTPLAAAMCEAHCNLAALGCGIDALYTYTDGLENCSLNFTMCQICDYCYRYHESGWNFDCDPNNPASCTDWQLCLADVFSMNGMTTVNYFGSPINPFVKGAQVPEDLYFLKYTADASDGEFNYYADAAFIPGDANGDGGINVSDAVYLINFVFVAGPAPSPLEAGDANCDEGVNVSDAVYIINYIFVGGPAPADCQ